MKNEMLDLLKKAESELPALLKNESAWNSLFVDYEKPHVERLWIQWNENRICLHKIHPCAPSESLFHPHPWPSAMRILGGEYEMGIGYGKKDSRPPLAAKIRLGAGSYYSMEDPHGWHYVAPLQVTYSVMVTGMPWGGPSEHAQQPKLRELTQNERESLFEYFKKEYH